MGATIDYFRELDTEPYGVNFADAASHQKFIDQLKLPFDLLVDEGFQVAELYGCLREGNTKMNARTVIIVGKNGQVIYRASGSPPVDELLEVISTASDETAP